MQHLEHDTFILAVFYMLLMRVGKKATWQQGNQGMRLALQKKMQTTLIPNHTQYVDTVDKLHMGHFLYGVQKQSNKCATQTL